MKHIVSVGGGIASTAMLPIVVATKYGKQNTDLIMAKLPNEDADVWRLCEAIEDYSGVPVKFIGKNLTPWDVFHAGRNINAVVNSVRTDPCSDQLKRKAIGEYILANYEPSQTVLHVGIGAWEIDRQMTILERWGKRGYKVEFDLIEMDWFDRAYAMRWCKVMFGFIPKLYELGFEHNNCGGGCIKAGHAQWARLLWYSLSGALKTHEGIPTFDWWETNEEKFRRDVNPNVAILRDWKNAGKPLPLTEFRRRMEARWGGFLPGFAGLMMGYKDLESSIADLAGTPGCAFCDAAA